MHSLLQLYHVFSLDLKLNVKVPDFIGKARVKPTQSAEDSARGKTRKVPLECLCFFKLLPFTHGTGSTFAYDATARRRPGQRSLSRETIDFKNDAERNRGS